MIKDILVRLDELDSNIPTLEAAADLAKRFNAHVTALFLNIIPMIAQAGEESMRLLALARMKGNAVEQQLIQSMEGVGRTSEVRRFDVFSDEVTETVIRECRTADVFLTRAAEGDGMERSYIEDVLFQSGRHVVLVPSSGWPPQSLRSIAIGWNAAREAARAVGEALPYFIAAETVTIIVVTGPEPDPSETIIGANLERQLRYHGISPILRHVVNKDGDTAGAILAAAKECDADLIVAGAYGHSRVREWLLGGVTRELLRHCPMPLLLAH